MPLDFASTVNSFKAWELNVVYNPGKVTKFSTAAILDWHKVEFLPINKTLVPKERGVYAFILEHNDGSSLPNHGYVLYIGITGDHSSHTLYDRFGDYIQEKRRKKRPNIHYMLNNWQSCLYFYYSEVRDNRINLGKLEKDMNDALIPPFSKKDFSADVRDILKAFRS